MINSPGLKRIKTAGVALAVFLVSAPAFSASKKAAADAVIEVLNAQKDAWNKGDLDGFMAGYLHSPDMSFTSGGKEVWGYDALKERYQKRYGQSKETMGQLKFTELKAFELGPKNELVIGHWHLDLASSSLDGVFSLVFVKAKDGWKCFHDHTSLAEKKPAEPEKAAEPASKQ